MMLKVDNHRFFPFERYFPNPARSSEPGHLPRRWKRILIHESVGLQRMAGLFCEFSLTGLTLSFISAFNERVQPMMNGTIQPEKGVRGHPLAPISRQVKKHRHFP